MPQEGRLDSIAIDAQALGEAAKLGRATGGGFLQPPTEYLRTTPS
jgi:hypothetical protein